MSQTHGERDWFGLVLEAVNPSLVIGLVGSLAFFLIDVLYAGQYEGRLRWTMFFFVLGAVMASRVALVVGSERGLLYGSLLGLVTFVATLRFAGGLGWLWNLTVIGVIAAASYLLTRDCTYLAGEAPGGRGLADELNSVWNLVSTEATKARGRRRGMWVVYFSAAALPVFGIGQSLIPPDDETRRRFAFWLMTVYIACALGLLLTTALVSFQAYLRSRKLKLPPAVTALWLGGGVTIIAVALAVGMLVPRPDPEYTWFARQAAVVQRRSASDVAPGADKAGEGKGRAGGGEAETKSDAEGRKGRPDEQAKAKSDRGKKGEGGRDKSDQSKSEGGERDEQGEAQPPPASAFEKLDGALQSLVRFLAIALVVVVVLILLIRNLAGVNAGARQWLERLAAWWQRMFGRADADAVAEQPEAPVLQQRRLADYPSPFAGDVSGRDTAELVTYSFAALEAWAEERGVGRRSGETPHEFAGRVGQQQDGLREPAQKLVNLYAHVAYTRRRALPDSARPAVAAFWAALDEAHFGGRRAAENWVQ